MAHGSCGGLPTVPHPAVSLWCLLCRYRSVQTQNFRLPFGTATPTCTPCLKYLQQQVTVWHKGNPFLLWHSAYSRCCATGLRWQLQQARFGIQLRGWSKGSATPGQAHLPVAEAGPEQGPPGRQDFPMQPNHFSQWNWGASLTHQARGDGDPQSTGKGKGNAAPVLLVWKCPGFAKEVGSWLWEWILSSRSSWAGSGGVSLGMVPSDWREQLLSNTCNDWWIYNCQLTWV